MVNIAPHGIVGATLGLIEIFLPGMLILLGALPFWVSFRKRPKAQAMMHGVNAAVAGLLAATFYYRSGPALSKRQVTSESR
jgi:chromate transporter